DRDLRLAADVGIRIIGLHPLERLERDPRAVPRQPDDRRKTQLLQMAVQKLEKHADGARVAHLAHQLDENGQPWVWRLVERELGKRQQNPRALGEELLAKFLG